MPLPVTLRNETNFVLATIAAGASLSALAYIPPGHEVVALIMPAVWTAAGLTFKASYKSSSLADVFVPAGTEYALVVVATNYVPLPAGALRGAVYIQVRSGTTGTPVNQVTACDVTLITRPTA